MELDIDILLKEAGVRLASDLHLTVGLPATVRFNGELVPLDTPILEPPDISRLAAQLLSENNQRKLEEKGEVDFAYSIAGAGRFRINVYRQRGSTGLAARVLNTNIPTVDELGLPGIVSGLTRTLKGLILVTGPTGSGKSTTLAAMIGLINRERKCHILTLEDPVEYLHQHDQSMINQREIGTDSTGFAEALRAALRQDPDVILVGEMRDLETISTAITAAETGHLVMSTLHTVDTPQTIDRIIDVFPPHQQQQIRVQLANTLVGIVAQRLIERRDGQGRVPAVEVLVANPAIRNLIREGKTYQIYSMIQTGSRQGMQLMDESLRQLYEQKLVDYDTAICNAVDPDNLSKLLGKISGKPGQFQ